MGRVQVAHASVIGTEHARAGKNNQDAVRVVETEHLTIAVVCDGCSSGGAGTSHNEVGAWIGAHVVANSILHGAEEARRLDWGRTSRDVLRDLFIAASTVGRASTVADFFLFTIVVAVLTRETATFAAIGDGVVIVNGERLPLGPFPDNTPPYLGYALMESKIESHELEFNVLKSISKGELKSFLIGSDGCEELCQAADQLIPGTTKPVGPIERLWTEDRFFGNPDALRRHLTLVNGGIERKHRGYLPDDTTLVVGRQAIHD